MDKVGARKKRAKKTRKKIQTLDVKRMSVHRTAKHIYVQIFDEKLESVLASASTVEKVIKDQVGKTGNIDAATAVGKLVAERAKAKGVECVAFDRAGFKYHGRIKALADAAREVGLSF